MDGVYIMEVFCCVNEMIPFVWSFGVALGVDWSNGTQQRCNRVSGISSNPRPTLWMGFNLSVGPCQP